MTTENAILTQTTLQLLQGCRRLLVLSGAGISAESGIPTFREAQTGLWAQYSPADLATPEAFDQHPERIWAWYQWRRNLIARGGPNAGHHALADLTRTHQVFIATQNVDGLHTAAGNRHIAELHGNIWRNLCSHCGATNTEAMAESSDDSPRYCQNCGHMARPDIIWFGETLPMAALQAAENELDRCDAILIVGTSNRVYPAASLAEAAVASSRPVLEINPRTTPLTTAVDVHIATSASQALPALATTLQA